MDVLVSLLSQRAVGGERRVFRGRKRKGARTGGVTGEIWESSLGFERPSFGPAIASGWMPQALGPCWGCLPVSPEPAGPAQCGFVTAPRQLETSWEPLICSAPAMIHQRQPNPRWTQADMAQSSLDTPESRAPAAVSCWRPMLVQWLSPAPANDGLLLPVSWAVKEDVLAPKGEGLCVPVATTQIDS
jgi:hypothetical protein